MLTQEYLESKLVPELKDIAKKLGITNYSKLRKAEIISVILKHPINKEGLVVKKPSAKKVAKKASSEKKVKAAPKKKKSPGFFDQVKGLFFSEPKKKATKKATKPKVDEKKKRTSVKKVKSIPTELRMLKEEAKENANLSQSTLRKKYASPKKARTVKTSGILGIPAFKKSLMKKEASPQKYNFRGSPVY
jgi:transcription termination factor Rho